VVESNPLDAAARRLLGDAFLRNGWFDDAYRQYATLQALAGTDPASLVRLARAAAGAGRTDEALRVLRKVLELPLAPSTSDPRDWARLWSIDTVARLLLAARAANDAERTAALVRALKRTEAFPAAATLHLLSWQDLDAGLDLKPTRGTEAAGSDLVVAGDTGLAARTVRGAADAPAPEAAWAGRVPGRPVAWRMLTVAFDGKDFQIKETTGTLNPPKPVVSR
jgi:hypothetical protein